MTNRTRPKAAASTALAALATLAFWTGCREEPVRVYEVPKEQSRQVGATETSPHAQRPVLPQATWSAPDNWEEQPSEGMKLGAFLIPGDEGRQAEVSVFPLAGAQDIELATINMWRQELGLSRIEATSPGDVSQPVTISGERGLLVDLKAAEQAPETRQGHQTVAAILGHEGTTWIFKMSGPQELVTAEKENFIAFLKTVEIEEGVAASGLPAGHPPIGSGAPVASATASSTPSGEWETPDGWKQLPASGMRAASFQITGESGTTAELTVIKLAGAAGGLLANVNRWRGQIGLPPMNEQELAATSDEVDLNGRTATFVHFKGSNLEAGGKGAVLGAIVPRDGETWFYKMTGDSGLVAAQEDTFREFVTSSESKP